MASGSLIQGLVNPKGDITYIIAHMRFGHYGVQKMQKLWENGIKTGLSFKQHKIDCDACKLTKALRPHAESTNREGSTEPGQLIWSDVLVLNIESKEGYMYVVHFTDDFSRYSKIYFLKKRSDIYEAFKQYIIWFEKEYNKQES